MTYFKNNLKIIGGIEAVPFSWPSMAYIQWNYKATYNLSNTNQTLTFNGSCGGSLIDRQTILTTSSCIRSSVSYSMNGTNYTSSVFSNSYYPTIASQYTVYLGVHKKSSIDNYVTFTTPTIKLNVSKIIMVF